MTVGERIQAHIQNARPLNRQEQGRRITESDLGRLELGGAARRDNVLTCSRGFKFRLLGVLLDCFGEFGEHQKEMQLKALKRVARAPRVALQGSKGCPSKGGPRSITTHSRFESVVKYGLAVHGIRRSMMQEAGVECGVLNKAA